MLLDDIISKYVSLLLVIVITIWVIYSDKDKIHKL